MQKLLFSTLALCAALSGAFHLQAADTSEPQTALVIPVTKTVDFGLNAFIKRALAEARAKGLKTVIFEINTYGGELDAALEISRTITAVEDMKTVAFVKEKAISAGALIALSCRQLIMQKNSVIGDCAPIAVNAEGPQILGEKIQSPLRAEFRKLAALNGYPVKLAEAMVTKDLGAIKIVLTDGSTRYLSQSELNGLSEEDKKKIAQKTVIVEAGQLLTLHDREALELGFCSRIVSGLEELKPVLGLSVLEPITQRWDESLVRFLLGIAPILMIVGFLGIWIEIKTPGFGLPGIVGGTCIALLVLSKYLIGLSNYTEILILVSGLMLIGIEVFVLPGFGLAGVLGIGLTVFGLYLVSVNFVIPRYSWEFDAFFRWIYQLGASIAVALFGSLLFARVFPQSRAGRRIMVLDKSVDEAGGYTVELQDRPQINAQGTALSPLHPAGKIRIGEKIFDAVTNGEFIDKGRPVTVIKIEGTHILVKEIIP